ncbi:MAG: DUF4345 family protein [Rhizobiaceae bacterium]
MTFTFPQNAHDFLVMFVPALTILLGLAFAAMPRRILHFMGLEPVPGNPEAMGEGRSSFAGAVLAIGLGCLLLQDPIALQPGLNLMLALAWTVAAIGRLLQMLLDSGFRRKRIQARFLIAAGLSALAWSVTDVPYLVCIEETLSSCMVPNSFKDLILLLVALLTLVLGLIALFLPDTALRILKLQTRVNMPFAKGETRGTLAGFYIAIGSVYLMMPQPVDFVVLVMGTAWFLTGLGRIFSVAIDRGWAIYNMAAALFEGGIGIVILAIVLRLI